MELSRYIFNGLRLKIVTKVNGKDVLYGGYSQEMMGLVLGGLLTVELHSHIFSKHTYYFKTTK